MLAALALAPLPFGSYEPTLVGFWCFVLGICLILLSAQPLNGSQLVLAGCAGAVVLSYGFVLHEQLAEHPWLAQPDPAWQQAQAALGIPLIPSVSVARYQPWFALGRPLVCMLALACGFLSGADYKRARQIVKTIAWSGAAYALYGIVAQLVDPTRILWREKEAYLGYLTATFVNRNTAAAYFGSCAVIWSLLLWERIRSALPQAPIAWRQLPSRLLPTVPRNVLVAFAALFICLAALFMTGSRGAVILSLAALLFAFVTFFRRDLPQRTGVAMALAGGGAFSLLLFELMGAGINARFDIQGAADEGRLATYKSTLKMIGDHPWFGTGQGTFAYAFPAYRSSDITLWGVWDIAHNTLLEIASDMGIPIAGLVFLGWMAIFAFLVHGVRNRRRGAIVPVAALAVALLAASHSLIDFTLQIPGYSIVMLCLIGAGVTQSCIPPKTSNKARLEHCAAKGAEQ